MLIEVKKICEIEHNPLLELAVSKGRYQNEIKNCKLARPHDLLDQNQIALKVNTSNKNKNYETKIGRAELKS